MILDCVLDIYKSQCKMDIMESLLLAPYSQSNGLSRGKICTVKKHCSNLLPALINEYNIPIIISYFISSSGYLLHLRCIYSSDLYRSVDLGFYH